MADLSNGLKAKLISLQKFLPEAAKTSRGTAAVLGKATTAAQLAAHTESQLDVREQALTFLLYLATTDKRVVRRSYWLRRNDPTSKDAATLVLPCSWRR